MKNPNRVAAGKINQKKRQPLTPEARRRLQEATRAHQPWLKSTGPKSTAGKAVVAMNALKPKPEPSVAVVIAAQTLSRMRALIRQPKG